MADEKRLTGEDAEFYHLSIGSELVGDGVSDLDTLIGGSGTTGSYFVITAVGGSTAFDSDLAVKDVFWDDGTFTPAVGDNCKQFTEINDCSVAGWSLDFSKSKIDVTTLCDKVKASRSGKSEATGTLNAFFTTGGTASVITERNKLISQFIQLIDINSASGVASGVTKTTPNDTTLYLALRMDEETTAGNYESTFFLPVKLESHSVSAEIDNPDGQAINFSIDGSDATVEPSLVNVEKP